MTTYFNILLFLYDRLSDMNTAFKLKIKILIYKNSYFDISYNNIYY